MTQFLVYSWAHGLLPFAHRLRLEGHDVEVVVHKRWYEAAWDGKVRKVLRASDGTLNQAHLEPVLEEARAGRLVVLSDSPDLADTLGYLPLHYPKILTTPYTLPKSPIRLGAWFDGEQSSLHHLLVVDVGLWPGGLGHETPGGLTQVELSGTALEWATGWLNETESELKRRSFKGLYQVGMVRGPEGELTEDGLAAGWPYLHAHSFLSELEDFGGLLSRTHPRRTTPEVGDEAPPMESDRRLVRPRYTVVLPVTMPPWPVRSRQVDKSDRAAQVAVEGLEPQQLGRLFWHDVSMNEETGLLRTAGLDGFVAVARGASDSLSLARLRATEVAGLVRWPQKQWRPDVGGMVDGVLVGLERVWGLRL